LGVLQRFERRIESLVSGAFARAFKSEVQPVEVAAALQRECDDRAAIVARDRRMVPNEFVVELGEHDHERLAPYAQALTGELADMVREHAEEQGYQFIGPVSVALHQVGDLDTGRFRVRSEAVAGVVPRQDQTMPAGRGTVIDARVEIAGSTYALTRAVTVLGRSEQADLRIDDPGVSRRHAEIRLQRELAEIVDLGSTNGIVIDGHRVERAALEDGTTVRLGSTTLVFRRGGGS
jgi:hypothetical protein